MKICWYITSHGLGHSVRACAVCGHLPAGTGLHFRTAVPQRFFQAELQRPFDCSSAAFDCGCLQSDSVTVAVAQTVTEYAAIAAANRSRLAHEAAWLRAQGFDVVVCDIPPFPLAAARAAGIPAVALANFTWHDVYAEYASECPRVLPLLEEMAVQYAQADLLVEAAPALPMSYFTATRVPVEIIGRPSVAMRGELRDALAIPDSARLALIYLGTFPLQLAWERLAVFDNWVFLCAEPLAGAPDNFRCFDRSHFAFRRVAASVDLLIGKLGYCTVSDCMMHGVPLLYVPRSGFAEYPLLEDAVKRWGYGYRVSEADFRAMRWGAALAALAAGAPPAPVDSRGAAQAAEAIMRCA